MTTRNRGRVRCTWSRTLMAWPGVFVAVTLLALPTRAHAQTDYYNIDSGRPVEIEDAFPTERYAFELKLAPVRVTRGAGGVYNWGLNPEIAYGILPGTHIEIGAPIGFVDRGVNGRRAGLAGIDFTVLHNLNVETSLPAFGIAGTVLFPVGFLAPDRVYPSLKALATRSFGFARLHLNVQYTFGKASSSTAQPSFEEVSRWTAGGAVDKTFPLKALLLIGDVYVRKPLQSPGALEWNSGAGLRYQVNPSWAVDAGVGKTLNGPDKSWFVTFGTAYAFALRSLIPVAAR